ncbi:MAG: aromatic-ring-hydroxylating dioxygenase subunit beta, partial [Candidatus Binatia bacterium]
MSPAEIRARVEELLFRYAAVIDDGDLSAWPGFFVEDGVYKLIPRENYLKGLPVCLMYCKNRAMIEDRVAAIQKASIYSPHYYRHHYSNIRVEDANVDQATLLANYVVHRTQDDGDTIVFSTGRIIARLTLADPLQFMTKTVVYDTFRIPDLLV